MIIIKYYYGATILFMGNTIVQLCYLQVIEKYSNIIYK